MTKTNIKTAELDDDHEIFGQYASDWAFDPSNPNLEDKTGTLEARGDGDAGFHQGDILFDHEQRHATDEATGNSFNRHSKEAELEEAGLSIGDLATKELRKRGLDAATEKWLREHDPDYQERQWQ